MYTVAIFPNSLGENAASMVAMQLYNFVQLVRRILVSLGQW